MESHPEIVRQSVGLRRQGIACVECPSKMSAHKKPGTKPDARQVEPGFLTGKRIKYRQLPGVAKNVNPPVVNVFSKKPEKRWTPKLNRGEHSVVTHLLRLEIAAHGLL